MAERSLSSSSDDLPAALPTEKPKKRRSSGAGAATEGSAEVPKRARRAALPEWSLNTNISVLKGIEWSVSKAIRELIVNCLDEDPDATVEKTGRGEWTLTNTVPAGHSGLSDSSFEYSSNTEKQESRVTAGKFGYGLKDAIAILLAHGCTFKARGPHATYTAEVREGGTIWIVADRTTPFTGGAIQIIGRGPECQLSKSELAAAVREAKQDCLPFCKELTYNLIEHEVRDDDGELLGTVYCSDSAEGYDDIFVHNIRYQFRVSKQKKRSPLLLLYNLNMSKKSLRSRDRNRLPDQWFSALTNLIKYSEPALEYLANAVQKQGSCYETTKSLINGYVNVVNDRREAKMKRTQELARLAEEKLRAAEMEARLMEEHECELALVAEKLEEANELPAHQISNAKAEAFEARTRSISARSAVVDYKLEVDNIHRSLSAALGDQVVAVGYGTGTQSSPVDLSVRLARIKSTNDPRFKTNPTREEDIIMKRSNISREYFPIVRELHRILCLVGKQDTVNIKALESGADDPQHPVRLVANDLEVEFTASDEDIVRAAILVISTSGMFPALRGSSDAEAVAAVAAVVLQHTSEDVSVIVKRNPAPCAALGGTTALLEINATAFCPLLVATEWDTTKGGISSFNMQLAQGLAAELRQRNPSSIVYVLARDNVPPAQREAANKLWSDARSQGIHVVDASIYRGEYTPMLTSAEFASITHIVGHAHVTGDEAYQISQLPQLRHTKLWQINHVLPRFVDTLKEDGTSQQREVRARAKHNKLSALNYKASFVWSVGEEMFNEFDAEIDARKHKMLLLPLNPDFLAQPTPMKDFKKKVKVLYFGRTEDVYFVKGMDIAAAACAEAGKRMEGRKDIVLVVLGTAANAEAETVQRLQMELKSRPHLRDAQVVVEGFASPQIVRDQLHKAGLVIMPSRMEPFGLVATEAIACGVPVLVSKNSGVALLLKNHYDAMTVKTSLHRPDVENSAEFNADVEDWATAIVRVVNNGPVSFEAADLVRDFLMTKIKPPYADIIDQGEEELGNR